MPRKERLKNERQKQAAVWKQRYGELGPAPRESAKLHSWCLALGALVLEESANDFGSSAVGRERRRAVMQALRWFRDVLNDGAMNDRLGELERALAEARGDQPGADA